jgi:hypothetical protein
MGATATVEIDTERDKDAQAIFEKSQEINKVMKKLPVCNSCGQSTFSSSILTHLRSLLMVIRPVTKKSFCHYLDNR